MAESEARLLALLGYVFLQNARPDKAASVLAALDVLAGGQPRVLRGLAVAQVRSGKPHKALETLDRLAMAGGVDAAFHLLRAQALGAAQRTEEAAVAMKTYVQMRGAAAPAASA
ncbi:MAG TPA: tetratricopeptide repeat protein [Ramlibacter sp.]|jgi:Flp pilus assembly protein TadD|uniref:type III secretion apparatus assembly chaperone SctY n=1 Tax=Ramlibacter sp. TaxID=1917967 RepID=UPI002D67C746|nr:tetratricopeptide repeat protein [Ramlibacter sp.]HZY20499.1 tetratricopeptide repeat protein [Ramlibacter sp.]